MWQRPGEEPAVAKTIKLHAAHLLIINSQTYTCMPLIEPQRFLLECRKVIGFALTTSQLSSNEK